MDFRILGPVEVLDDAGRSVALGGARQRALLAILLLHAGEAVSVDRLADDLWGDEPPATAAHTIQVFVSRLRKALRRPDGRQPIATRPPGYAIELDPGELDLARFEQLAREGREALAGGDPERAAQTLRTALGLFRGRPLAEFAYESFADPAVARLEELRLACLEERIEADLACGKHVELCGELEQLVREHPLRERLRGQLMLALYRAGRQADALEAYQAARRALVDELGIEPGPSLQELERAILRQDRTLDLPAAAPPAPAAAPPARAILLVAEDEGALTRLLALGGPLARSERRHDLIVAKIVPPGDAEALRRAVGGLNDLRGRLSAGGLAVRTAAFTSAEPAADLVKLASEQDVDLLLADLSEPPQPGRPFPPAVAAVLEQTPCDVGLAVARGEDGEGPVLVPFAGGEHDWAALELGAWLATARGAQLNLLGTDATPDQGRRDASRLLAHASLLVQGLVGIAAELVLAEPGPAGLVEAARGAGVVVVGLPDSWRTEGPGSARGAAAREVPATTILVRRGPRPGGLAPGASLTRYTWSLGGG